MTKHRTIRISLAILLTLAALGLGNQRRRPVVTGVRETIVCGGKQRAYRVHVPRSIEPDTPAALVLLFHGGGGNADIGSSMGMSAVADREGFIVVYPEAINKHWNDGRDSLRFREQDAEVDDVAYVDQLLAHLQDEYHIDPTRIYATGLSNGGFMVQRLAIERSTVFAAVATVIATMPTPLTESFSPAEPISVMFMNGTDDPLVPYEGGEVAANLGRPFRDPGPSRGTCSSTDKAIDLWLQQNGLEEVTPTITQLDDSDTQDGSRVVRKEWTRGSHTARVVLYRVEGGGHTIPGGRSYLPERIIGRVNRDIDGLQTIWDFFAEK